MRVVLHSICFYNMKALIIISFFLTCFFANAQKINNADNKLLKQTEDTLALYSKQMVFAQDASSRFYADSIFIKTLVRALKINNSFSYPFDSVTTISKIYPPDSSFRIFTWQIERDESYFRQYGAIQMRTKEGSLKFFPLIDASDYTSTPTDSVRSNTNWIGAIYYGIVAKEYKGKKYYTLFGFDDNDFVSTKKWLEELTFNANSEPVFGGPFFDYKEDSIKPAQPAYRFCLEYKKDAKARMVYDPDLDLIIFDHLISESNEVNKKFTLIPDGDYEGFKWSNGKWLHIDKVFSEQQLKNGQFPMPAPILDDNGKPNN